MGNPERFLSIKSSRYIRCSKFHVVTDECGRSNSSRHSSMRIFPTIPSEFRSGTSWDLLECLPGFSHDSFLSVELTHVKIHANKKQKQKKPFHTCLRHFSLYSFLNLSRRFFRVPTGIFKPWTIPPGILPWELSRFFPRIIFRYCLRDCLSWDFPGALPGFLLKNFLWNLFLNLFTYQHIST